MSDEVSDFLRSVEALKERREEEDEARSRELEEKILQEKRERQARRAERARSISPQKSSPANTPPPPPTSQRNSVVQLPPSYGGSVDLGRNLSVSSRKHEVKTGGLMRSTPMGAAAKSAAGLVGMPSIPTNEKSAVSGFRGNLSNSAARRASEDAQVEAHVENTQKWGSGGSVGIATKANQDTPPKNDFRTNLKPRAPPPDSGNGQSKDELKNVLGSLRRTRTQNYVAPDTLKSNILQGKSALSLTGGPKKTERVDELKEAILKKKDDIKKAHSLESSLKSPDINRLSQASTDSRQESADVAPRDVPAASSERPRSPPKGARPLPIPRSTTGKAYTEIATPMRSPTKYGLELSSVFTEFFGPERPKRDYKVDAAEVLMNRPSPGPRIRTQQAQLFQVSGDGKKLPVPAHHERVLFEREMYLCPHTFETGAGKKVTEVYFWVGDEVPEPTADEAQVFVQREAKSFGGRLVKLTQGKESPEFLQALGGIVIVRRGTSKKYDSLAPNMLCGRRYLGQVVFDEVDFAPSSLCSGFPYLITQQGKCYLWKGKGSDVEELGCARLIGMDQALMGELTEVEEGDEPESFWHMFDGGAKASSADHWRLKPNYDKYCGRLFWSKPAGKQQMVEMSPYSQTDLLPSNIYVLDAFFELYIVVGARSQHQYAAFRNALDFAQEYAILAAGMEDRPFVPISTVVLEGIPRDLKSVFRKWRDDASPTVMNPNNPTTPNLKRGRSLRIVPLNQALQALTE
ncbi:hypothetical protein P8C59_000398 [Phyllachora maydis]|uniref:Gelsolin n=1 Tax=Phyllachora maydis TaxID=1825666 RepID=A0AAD9HVY1_9PEZI|nr:hypothetical protein P8C59_000398 [Phyllachora maydis]